MPEVTEVEAADPTYMEISTLRFTLAQPGTSAAAAEEAKGKLSALVEKHSMAPFYKLVCEQLGWPVDAAKLAAMEKVNAAELESLGEKIKNAEENEGESEIREAYLARADFLMRTGEKEKALEAYDETVTKTVALGPKLDIMLSQLRIGFFFDDAQLLKAKIALALTLTLTLTLTLALTLALTLTRTRTLTLTPPTHRAPPRASQPSRARVQAGRPT